MERGGWKGIQLEIDPMWMMNLGSSHKVNPFSSIVNSPAYIFIARKLSFGEPSQEGTELIEKIKVPFKEAVQMVVDSIITHGQSAVLILKSEKYLNQNDNV